MRLWWVLEDYQGLVSFTRYYIVFGEGNGNPLQYSCLENPMDRGAWHVMVHETWLWAESQTWLKWLSTHYVLIYFLPTKHGKEGWELLTHHCLALSTSCVAHSHLGGSVTDRQDLYFFLCVPHGCVNFVSCEGGFCWAAGAELTSRTWVQVAYLGGDPRRHQA